MNVLTYLLILAATSPTTNSQSSSASLPRTEVVKLVQKATTVPSTVYGLAKDNAKAREKMLADAGQYAESLAKDLLPVSVEGPDSGSILRVASETLVLRYNDQQCIELAVRIRLESIVLKLMYEMKWPPPAREDIHAVMDGVDSLLKSTRENMIAQITGSTATFSDKEISDYFKTVSIELERDAENRDKVWLKVPLNDGDTKKISLEFDSRLRQSVDRIGKRLAAVGGGDPRRASQIAYEKRQILREVITPIVMLIRQFTTDQRRLDDFSVKVFPNYRTEQRKLSEREAAMNKHELGPADSSTQPFRAR